MLLIGIAVCDNQPRAGGTCFFDVKIFNFLMRTSQPMCCGGFHRMYESGLQETR